MCHSSLGLRQTFLQVPLTTWLQLTMTSVADRIREVAFPFLADVQIYRDLMESSVAMPTKPDAKLQVIGAGFSRTATLSMYAAFQQLGYKVGFRR